MVGAARPFPRASPARIASLARAPFAMRKGLVLLAGGAPLDSGFRRNDGNREWNVGF